ncbi:uncharacterized protein CLUP02_10453 [Colletotrichum lupini]|uniref:Uncharacterized protein n=1 Tax=Colletotrichum lupini TaxID=145971 RepID=A0A9Q8SWQ2_9PEZI|nr:uncharacterized protein CLUP02_10453 [Colletotrichum lupini]UQC84957.1 hypothetical protein CLUP02_10453 [Colletotrichum lupini]
MSFTESTESPLFPCSCTVTSYSYSGLEFSFGDIPAPHLVPQTFTIGQHAIAPLFTDTERLAEFPPSFPPFSSRLSTFVILPRLTAENITSRGQGCWQLDTNYRNVIPATPARNILQHLQKLQIFSSPATRALAGVRPFSPVTKKRPAQLTC